MNTTKRAARAAADLRTILRDRTYMKTATVALTREAVNISNAICELDRIAAPVGPKKAKKR